MFVVLDPNFAGDLWGLSRSGHVWIVDTEANKVAARQVWSRKPAPQLPTQGVTTFVGVAHDPDTLYSMLPTIDQHHGGNSAAVPWQIIHVRGLHIGDVSEPRVTDELAEVPVRLLPEPGGFAIFRAGQQAAAADRASRGS
ncbi:MAG: hypothetical protein AB7O97_18170 [Planctomycetota bacterium]